MSVFVEPEVLGAQRPRICHVPPFDDAELGDRAMELLSETPLELDEWQEMVLRASLNMTRFGKFAAFRVGLCVPRQNGKDAVMEARELVALFLLRERMVIHSAHQYDTAMEHFRRLTYLIEETPSLSKQLKPRGISWSHGSEGIELKSGERIRFRTRTKGGGIGFSCNLLLLNEAMVLPEVVVSALLPTMRAQPNPQVWLAGSAVDQEKHADGVAFARMRESGLNGDPDAAYFEWSVEGDDPSAVPESVAADPQAWAQANPGLGIRVSPEFMEKERRGMAERTFATECLGVGDWPATSLDGIIGLAQWAELVDRQSKPTTPLVMSLDITPDRAYSTFGVAGRRDDGAAHLEVVGKDAKLGRTGTDWVVDRAAQLDAEHQPDMWVVDPRSAAGSLLPALERVGIRPHLTTAQEHAQGCGLLVDAVTQRTCRHLGQPPVASAIKGAVKRNLGDAWAWDRRSSGVDISPLVAVTLALWGLNRQDDRPMIRVFS